MAGVLSKMKLPLFLEVVCSSKSKFPARGRGGGVDVLAIVNQLLLPPIAGNFSKVGVFEVSLNCASWCSTSGLLSGSILSTSSSETALGFVLITVGVFEVSLLFFFLVFLSL